MTPAVAGRLVLLFASALLTGVAGGACARAASIDTAYDMDRLLNEPHPLANEYGTRWRPAPVEPRTPLPPRPAAQPMAAPATMPPPLPAPVRPIPPPSLLPVPAGAVAEPAITPNLTIDEPATPPPAPAAAPPPKPTAEAQPAPPPLPPPGRAGQRTAQTTTSTVRIGGRPERGEREGLGWLSEVRVGALAHDFGPFSHNKEKGAAANVELLFKSPELFKYIWSPRPHVGLDITTNGTTNDVYFGLSYEWEFWRYMFGGFSLGGAYHDGYSTNAPEGRKELGCKLLFRESLELGVRFAERHSVSAFLDHISNAKICSTNEGLENAGVRYGYKF